MYELYLPFFGELNLFPWLVGAALLLMFGPQLPTLALWGAKGLGSLGAMLVGKWMAKAKDTTTLAVLPVVEDAAAAFDKSIAALHEVTTYVVKEGTGEALESLGKLYGELQKKARSAATMLPLALALAVVGCDSSATTKYSERCGWSPATAEEHEKLYGDADESLKAQAPHLFD